MAKRSQTKSVVWYDGKFIPAERATVPLLSHALHYGSGVFEGIRVYKISKGSAIFRLKEHVDRLFQSAVALGIKIPHTKQEIELAIIKTVRRNGLAEGYVRPLIYYGEGQMTLFPKGAVVHTAIATWPWPAYLGESPLLALGISPFVRFDARSVVPGAKISGLYAAAVMATIDIRKRGFHEAILLNVDGSVAEGPGENIFVVRHGNLYTPDSPAVLKGITRDTVMALARDLHIPAMEKKITPGEMMASDEVFLCGTAAEIAPVGKIENKRIGDGKLGPITEQIRNAYYAVIHGENKKYLKYLTKV